MKTELRFCIGTVLFDMLADRFTTYSDTLMPASLEEKLERASRVSGLKGVAFLYPTEISEKNIDKAKQLLKAYGLKIATVSPDIYGHRKWKYGSLSSSDENTRNEAIQTTKKSMEIAKELGCSEIMLWLGQDGYDYLFQVNYDAVWERLISGIKKCAEHDPEIKICLEYKLREPLTHQYVGTVGKALLIANHLGLKNVGVTLDVGHAIMAQENPDESAVLLNKWNKLFQIHLSDNFRDWDHNMMPGTANFWDFLELIFWLQLIKYDGWYVIDICPLREDLMKACEQSIQIVQAMIKLIDKIGVTNLKQRIQKRTPTSVIETFQALYQNI